MSELTINTEERLKGVVYLVVDKAINEPRFSEVYANMCHCLSRVSTNTSIMTRKEESVTFRVN